jgi:outer membrane protein TolC
MSRRIAAAAAALGFLLVAAPAPAQVSAQRSDSTARPLSLLAALELAERESETVGLARTDVARAKGDQRRARSGYFPQLSGAASYQRTLRSQFSALENNSTDTTSAPATECARFTPQPGLTVEQRLDSLETAVECASASDPFANFRNLPFGRENTYRLGLSFSQTLFSGGQVSGRSQSAAAGLRSAELGVSSARAQLILDVTQAYYDAVLGDRLVEIAEATLQQADSTLRQTEVAREVGNQSEFDLLRARVTRDNQRPVVIQRRADRDLAHYRLKQLLDLPLDQPLALTTTLGDSATVEAPQVTELVASPGDTTTSARIPVRQADEAIRAQEGLLRTARGQWLPQLALTSDFAEFGYPGNGSPFGTRYISDWTVSLGLSLPLFTGGRIGGETDVARANVEQAKLRKEQALEQAQLDARNAQLQLASAIAAWEASAGTEEQAGRAYQIADLRYREGMSTQTEVNDVRIQLAQAQATRARAARDLRVAKVRLDLLPALPLSTGALSTSGTSGAGSSGGASTQRATTNAGTAAVPGVSGTTTPQTGVAGQ